MVLQCEQDKMLVYQMTCVCEHYVAKYFCEAYMKTFVVKAKKHFNSAFIKREEYYSLFSPLGSFW